MKFPVWQWCAFIGGFVIGFALVVAPDVEAQNPRCLPGCSFGFDQAAATLADAQAMIHRVYLDGSTTGITLSNKSCTGAASPFACQGLSPNMSNGQHTARFTAANAVGESAMSGPFVFKFGASPTPPATPSNFRIINP